MFQALVGKMLVQWGRSGLIALGVAGLLALGGLGLWRAVAGLERMIADRVAAAVQTNDAAWRMVIETSNAKAANAVADGLRAAMAANDEAEAEIERLRRVMIEQETANEELPDDGRCGLGRDRVRLLD